MRRRVRTGHVAFTLIELMMVVAIVGILAMLGAYGVRKYVINSKTAEARNALGRMAGAAAITYENETMAPAVLPTQTSTVLLRTLCKTASTSVPTSPAMIAGRKYQSSPADWNVDSAGNSGFSCLHFTIEQPQYFMYSYAISGSGNVPGDSFLGTANGDLDGDSVLSTFQITGSINSSYVLNIAPNMVEVNPDE